MVKHTTSNANRRPKAITARDYRYFPSTYAQFARSQRHKIDTHHCFYELF